MIEPEHPTMSIVKQCELVSISRSSYYYEGKGESGFNLELILELEIFNARLYSKQS